MELNAKKRKILGKKVKSLRLGGTLPAILFGGDEGTTPLELNAVEFGRVYAEAGESTLLDLDLDGKKETILIAEVQRDPLGKILHADLRKVEAGEKITATVPIEAVGESTPVKAGEGVLLTLLTEVEVECYPQDLPQKIVVDISDLNEVGQGVEIKSLPIDQSKVQILEHEPDELVVKIDFPQEKEVEEVPVAEEEAVAAVKAVEEKPEEEVPEELTEKEKKPLPEEKPKASPQ